MHNIFCRYFWDMRVEFPKVNKYVLRNKMKYFAKWSCVWFGSMWKWNYGTNFSSNLINEWRKYLLSEASKVTWHSNLSCTCVKSLKLWIAFVPNILEKIRILHLRWCNLFGKYLKNMPSCTCPRRPIWREILANFSTPAPWHWSEWKWIAVNHSI